MNSFLQISAVWIVVGAIFGLITGGILVRWALLPQLHQGDVWLIVRNESHETKERLVTHFQNIFHLQAGDFVLGAKQKGYGELRFDINQHVGCDWVDLRRSKEVVVFDRTYRLQWHEDC